MRRLIAAIGQRLAVRTRGRSRPRTLKLRKRPKFNTRGAGRKVTTKKTPKIVIIV